MCRRNRERIKKNNELQTTAINQTLVLCNYTWHWSHQVRRVGVSHNQGGGLTAVDVASGKPWRHVFMCALSFHETQGSCCCLVISPPVYHYKTDSGRHHVNLNVSTKREMSEALKVFKRQNTERKDDARSWSSEPDGKSQSVWMGFSIVTGWDKHT